MVEPIVFIKNVTVKRGGITVLEDISLKVEHGDFMAVLGPNGGGKSTLLKLILGLLKPDLGTVRVLGGDAGSAGGNIGYLPQHTHVSDSFPVTVLEAVHMGTVQPGFSGIAGLARTRSEIKSAYKALERVNMQDFAKRRLAGLSGGQKQRVFIARALVSQPKLLLLDEPTASVDSSSRNSLFALLSELNKDMTVIMVSHDISSLASGVKSVACVNKDLHFHKAPQITNEMFKMSYGGEGENCCPVELVTHGDIPHRVLGHHHGEDKE